jgi:hypothetical protein
MPCTTHKPIATGHAITCEMCMTPLASWGVTAPMFGFPPKTTNFPAVQFSAVNQDVKQGKSTVARAVSGNMAKRIANALNDHQPNHRGQ